MARDTRTSMVITRVLLIKDQRLRNARIGSPSDLSMEDTTTTKRDGGNQNRIAQNTSATD